MNYDHQPIISVIIPVYNSELYLREALSSIIQQSFTDYEVLCVDDASTDRSLDILKEFAGKDHRFQVLVNTERSGAARSRNKGLSKAKGEYIIFLDSDDVFYENLLMSAYTDCQKYQAELVMYGYHVQNITSIQASEHYEEVTTRVNSRELIAREQIERVIDKTDPVPWNKLVARTLLTENNIIFQDIPNNNDVYYSFAVALCARRIMISDEILLTHKRNRADSLTKDRLNKKNHILEAYDEVYRFVLDRQFMPSIKNKLKNYIISQIVRLTTDLDHRREVRCDVIRELREKYWYSWDIEGTPKEELDLSNQCFIHELMDGKTGEDISCGEDLLAKGALLLMQQCHARNERVALWGCGKLGQQIIDYLESHMINFDFVIDNDVRKQGTRYRGYLIYSYPEVKDRIDLILVTNRRWYDDIKNETGGLISIVCI